VSGQVQPCVQFTTDGFQKVVLRFGYTIEQWRQFNVRTGAIASPAGRLRSRSRAESLPNSGSFSATSISRQVSTTHATTALTSRSSPSPLRSGVLCYRGIVRQIQASPWRPAVPFSVEFSPTLAIGNFFPHQRLSRLQSQFLTETGRNRNLTALGHTVVNLPIGSAYHVSHHGQNVSLVQSAARRLASEITPERAIDVRYWMASLTCSGAISGFFVEISSDGGAIR